MALVKLNFQINYIIGVIIKDFGFGYDGLIFNGLGVRLGCLFILLDKFE